MRKTSGKMKELAMLKEEFDRLSGEFDHVMEHNPEDKSLSRLSDRLAELQEKLNAFMKRKFAVAPDRG